MAACLPGPVRAWCASLPCVAELARLFSPPLPTLHPSAARRWSALWTAARSTPRPCTCRAASLTKCAAPRRAAPARCSPPLCCLSHLHLPPPFHLPAPACASAPPQVVVAPPELHWQSLREPGYDGSLSGEIRSPLHSIPALPLDERRIIAHRWAAGEWQGEMGRCPRAGRPPECNHAGRTGMPLLTTPLQRHAGNRPPQRAGEPGGGDAGGRGHPRGHPRRRQPVCCHRHADHGGAMKGRAGQRDGVQRAGGAALGMGGRRMRGPAGQPG